MNPTLTQTPARPITVIAVCSVLRLASAWTFILLFGLGWRIHGAEAPLLAPCFGDNMVLKEVSIPSTAKTPILWGWTERKPVIVQFSGWSKEVVVSDFDDEPGHPKLRRWTLRASDLQQPLRTGGPYTLSVRAGKASGSAVELTARLTNVLVGQVWAVRLRHGTKPALFTPSLTNSVRLLRIEGPLRRGRSLATVPAPLPQTAWLVAGHDASQVRLLPSPVTYLAEHAALVAGFPPMGIIYADSEDQSDDSQLSYARDVEASTPFEIHQMLQHAAQRSSRELELADHERLQSKRRGEPTKSLVNASLRLQAHILQGDAEFFYNVSGFLR